MEDLFKAITANPVLLFIIIGAILRFLQKGKDQNTKSETQKPGAPRSKEAPQTEVDWREIFRQEGKTGPAPQKRQEQSYTFNEETSTASISGLKRSNELMEKYEIVKQNKKEASNLDEIANDSPIYKGDLTVRKQIKLDLSNITKEDVIKGIVWSEILGRPRAIGSYRSSMNLRKKQG